MRVNRKRMSNRKEIRSRKRGKRKSKTPKIIISVMIFLVVSYCSVVFLDLPVISQLRNIYIETAMTTGDHQWLATMIFPEKLIDRVMKDLVINVDVIGGIDEDSKDSSADDNTSEKDKLEKDDDESESDILNQRELKVGDLDYAGNKILVNDIEQGIIISEVKGLSFKGKIALIDDPSRVFVGYSDYSGRGATIVEMLDNHNSVLGINANGFYDPDGVGVGDQIIGYSMSKGESRGELTSMYCTIAFDENDNLIVGNVDNWNKYNIRDGGQFNPVLIANGEKITSGSSGWGIQPRTSVGQREDGVVMFLVIDGRQPSHSMGATVGDCADILESYGAINAACCDGGSSSIMGYNGEVITKCSSPMEFGRYLPNAFLVKHKNNTAYSNK